MLGGGGGRGGRLTVFVTWTGVARLTRRHARKGEPAAWPSASRTYRRVQLCTRRENSVVRDRVACVRYEVSVKAGLLVASRGCEKGQYHHASAILRRRTSWGRKKTEDVRRQPFIPRTANTIGYR